jgi:hypothetical protein
MIYKSPEANMQIRQKIALGKNVYLKYSMSGVVIRISGFNDFNWAKSKDKREYRVLYSSNLIDKTIQEANEISKSEYENYYKVNRYQTWGSFTANPLVAKLCIQLMIS